MKPHEETWDNGRDFEVTVCGPELDRDIDHPREVLARAAPKMARALLANGYKRASDGLWHSDCCNEQNDGGVSCFESCEKARAALTKAGVLP